MISNLCSLITADEPAVRDQPLEEACRQASVASLLAECANLERFRRACPNLYQRVRALFFLYALHRFHLPARPELPRHGRIPFAAHRRLLARRFDEAIALLLQEQESHGPSEALSSALAAAYRALGFQTLADQVRRSVRGVRGNQWMFRTGHPADHPLRLRPELLRRALDDAPFPILHEATPVRMDLTHSAWSDIFFLGMDYPEGARVINFSIDLGVRHRDLTPRPPVDVYLRVLDEPLLRLVSVDLQAAADITHLAEVFDFAKDPLGLLKAALIASGIVPPGLEGSEQSLADLLGRLAGPGRGLELVSHVHGIPKGSRLAVSTTLLAAQIAVCMRATGQTRALEGTLREDERRLVAARAILGEWLGGSGGGWQDSGGVWPGAKRIEGAAPHPGDPEYGVSRGCLLPRHTLLGPEEFPAQARRGLEDSLILVHGGMAQNVGPILEMVTEKYLLRSEPEGRARRQALALLEELQQALRAGDIRALGALTTRNFQGPLQTIVPWAGDSYTVLLLERMGQRWGEDFWGFWMLGGMAGGGMGFLVDPRRKPAAQDFLLETMGAAQSELSASLPFAMKPVVYDFAINPHGTRAHLCAGETADMPPGYYALIAPDCLRQDPRRLTPTRRGELARLGTACRTQPALAGMVETLFQRLLPSPPERKGTAGLGSLLEAQGFDQEQHERLRADLQRGRVGLAQNRMPANVLIEDVLPGDLVDATTGLDHRHAALGREALAAGAVGVVTLAAGAGSRWTQGAGVVKALHPFTRLGGHYRTFLEVHLAKSRQAAAAYSWPLPHVITTGYLTHGPIAAHLEARGNYGYPGPLFLSPGRSVGLRLVPMGRDLRFAWEVLAQQRLDEQAQKVRDSLHAALIAWALQAGEGSDYTDNLPLQCLHPVGHWYEIPNLLLNGTLAHLLRERPAVRYLLVHNVDTLGAGIDESLLGLHIARGQCLTFEMIPRHVDDRGGGLARVDGRARIVEGLALPREEEEFALTYYNTLTTWVDLDQLLVVFGLTRGELGDEEKARSGVRRVAARVPTYITLKDVKKRWGHGQEDIYPVCQFEKLWGDMTALPDVTCGFVAVSRQRGQQLKEPAQLDGWLRDGSAAYVGSLVRWQ